jgi:hypothetical protein
MAKFVELKDGDGKAVLVNTEKVTMVRDIEGEPGVMMMTIAGEDVRFSGTCLSEIRKKFEDDTPERIASNLFHIWEILRARLH